MRNHSRVPGMNHILECREILFTFWCDFLLRGMSKCNYDCPSLPQSCSASLDPQSLRNGALPHMGKNCYTSLKEGFFSVQRSCGTLSPVFSPQMHSWCLPSQQTEKPREPDRTEFQHQTAQSEQKSTKWFVREMIPPNKRLACQKTANTELLEVAAQPSWEMLTAAWPAARPGEKQKMPPCKEFTKLQPGELRHSKSGTQWER